MENPVTWTNLALSLAVAVVAGAVSLGGLVAVFAKVWASTVVHLREDVAFHHRALSDLRTQLAAERTACDEKIKRQGERLEELEKRAGMRE